MAARRRRRQQGEEVEWDFFSFPVYFAFAAGALTVILLAPFVPAGILFVLALFGTSFGMAHIISHWFRRRVSEKRRQQQEEEERERRALEARQSAALGNEQTSHRRRRRRR